MERCVSTILLAKHEDALEDKAEDLVLYLRQLSQLWGSKVVQLSCVP